MKVRTVGEGSNLKIDQLVAENVLLRLCWWRVSCQLKKFITKIEKFLSKINLKSQHMY